LAVKEKQNLHSSKVLCGSRPNILENSRLAQLSDITDFDTRARLICTQLNVNHIEVILELPQKHPTAQVSPATPRGNALPLTAQRQASLNKSTVTLIKRSGSSDLDKKQQLFDECATFIHNIGASFAASRVHL